MYLPASHLLQTETLYLCRCWPYSSVEHGDRHWTSLAIHDHSKTYSWWLDQHAQAVHLADTNYSKVSTAVSQGHRGIHEWVCFAFHCVIYALEIAANKASLTDNHRRFVCCIIWYQSALLVLLHCLAETKTQQSALQVTETTDKTVFTLTLDSEISDLVDDDRLPQGHQKLYACVSLCRTTQLKYEISLARVNVK